MKPSRALLPAAIALLSNPVLADDHIEEMVVIDSRQSHSELLADVTRQATADSAQLLRTLPGANVNGIGPLSGIAQYRGLSGERVAVQLDGAPLLGGGPNAMDTPLSYAPSLLLKQLTVTRGIAPVSTPQESVGGQIKAQLDRGEFSNGKPLNASAKLSNRYQSVNNGNSSALRAQLANKNHKVALLASRDSGNNSEFAGGILAGTQLERYRYDLSYGLRSGDIDALFYLGRNQTDNTGTPALPMDINYVDTNLAGFEISTSVGEWQLNSFANYSDVSHGMDNFSQRQVPPMPMRFRNIDVQAKHLAAGISATTKTANGEWKLGFDTSRSSQDSDIFNPNNSDFLLRNFNDVERDVNGVYTQWSTEQSAWKLQIGVRYNRVDASAGQVSGATVPPPVSALANGFNSDNRDLSFSYVDLVAKASYALDSHRSVELGIGRKHRAPTYQELFLWAPLPITGGLADGRSYIGNRQLREERNQEITLGFTWKKEHGSYFTPQLFYRRVDDYIQGTAANNPMANMVSMMLSGAPALQFNNVDAELYGFDSGYGFALGEHWRIDGNLSYVQGERRDSVADNLYRLAPLNHRVALSYREQQWEVSMESLLYSAQKEVSQFNNEQTTGGYGLVNLSASYDVSDSLVVSGGIGNLFDKHYRDHLAGYNRNGNSDIAVGERLAGNGRNLFVAVSLNL